MTFTKYEGELPKRKYHKLEGLLNEFMNMNTKIVKVEFEDEYKSAKTCRDTFAISAKRYCLPIYAQMNNGEVYLIRRDM